MKVVIIGVFFFFPMAKLKVGNLTLFPHDFFSVCAIILAFHFPNIQLWGSNWRVDSLRLQFLTSVSVDFCLKACPAAWKTEASVVGMNSFVSSRGLRGNATPDGPPHACSRWPL